MFEMHPVLEVFPSEGFTLWPVAEFDDYGFLPLTGALVPAEVGAAVMRIAACNDVDPEGDGRPPRPGDPVGAFLHGLFTMDVLFAAGGLRVTDTATGVTVLPGCCSGLEDWRDGFGFVDGSAPFDLGHDPGPLVERCGDLIRLTADTEADDSPVIELPVAEWRRLLADVERDLADFLRLAAGWAGRHLPDHAAAVAAALARALSMPAPVVSSERPVVSPER
ncbi:hypothetical protein [Streptomyces telluris]|uniref:Uncharacterized protein n=2 Tax=Streptomyces telluris TaxID=2720021 RepID=A0A9X2RP40_9ACTN|nr:hypothetical protein [Streptomyces telluris]MCQ8771061.1 hypothetical protein [Streptomyces telluris]